MNNKKKLIIFAIVFIVIVGVIYAADNSYVLTCWKAGSLESYNACTYLNEVLNK